MEFQAVVEKKGDAIPTLIFWFLFESLTCWKGQCLENASISLAEQVYEYPWYDLDPTAMSIFKIFYKQVQVTLQLKCPPIITINFAYFYEVMKGSYSVLMYLQKMY
ncbi:uncharacterized protein LOC123320824 isoform X2 [Coccinella septempunctata]|uniref:uncharacterized protein LOC123320824 isoform X2 n=1 Tax=Coccinella septempunctata TaxID=41139 RepID=UPI001D084545|nr:uncharacterized protein LOC123320824 isoform X2 [Coccinella septempunctata]